MDKWFVNMVAGAVLSALLVIFGANTFVKILYPTGGEAEAPPAHSETADAAGAKAAPEEAPKMSLASMLGQASADNGAKQIKKCAACHTFDEGGANKIGPNLHGLVGREVAGLDGFSYSGALKEYGGVWDYEKLACFLKNPKKCVPGNKMSFGGLKKDRDLANVIVYLRSISPNAPELPEDKAADAGSDAAPEATEASAVATQN